MKLQISYMMQKEGGAIVNMASVAAVKAIENLSVYSCTKAAIVSLGKVAAKEYAKYGIRINTISPGLTMTDVARRVASEHPEYFEREILDVIPLKKAAQPDEIAKLVVWLCSDEASFMTGHNLIVDGGASL